MGLTYNFQSIKSGSDLHLKHIAISLRHSRSVTIQSPAPFYLCILVFESSQLRFGAMRTWYDCCGLQTPRPGLRHDNKAFNSCSMANDCLGTWWTQGHIYMWTCRAGGLSSCGETEIVCSAPRSVRTARLNYCRMSHRRPQDGSRDGGPRRMLAGWAVNSGV